MNETAGTLIGLSNVMTRLRARVSPGPAWPNGSFGALQLVK